jgi:hypothetical protein
MEFVESRNGWRAGLSVGLAEEPANAEVCGIADAGREIAEDAIRVCSSSAARDEGGDRIVKRSKERSQIVLDQMFDFDLRQLLISKRVR